MTELSVHRVTKVDAGPVQTLGVGSFTRRIWVTDEEGNKTSLLMFAETTKRLEVGQCGDFGGFLGAAPATPDLYEAGERLADATEAFRTAEALSHPDAAKCARELDEALDKFRTALEPLRKKEAA